MEVIDHRRRARQHVADRCGVAAELIDRSDLDSPGPAVGSFGDPVAYDIARTIWHDVQQACTVDVDERGRHLVWTA